MRETLILKGFEYAREQYESVGVDVEKAIGRADDIALSMHCWQGDDVVGFEGSDTLTGGIAVTGNYPGRARTPDELREDINTARKFIPGKTKLNLHACYAEKNGRKIDRDSYTIEEFSNWTDWAKQQGLGLDFNPTFFSHPKMDGNFSLSSFDESTRRFWIEHGKRCREIGLEFAKRLGEHCVVNYWMPDGYKDNCADSIIRRNLMTKSLDSIFSEKIDEDLVPCAIESKLFGVGIESYTVVNHEYALCYALSRDKLYCLDAGHFHPTESIATKISPILLFMDKILLHVSRGIRWDSDHVVTYEDELQYIMDEIIFNDLENRVYIGLDYFDASINRIAAWVIGMRNARKALLTAALTPISAIRNAEIEGDHTLRLALMEERKNLPIGAVWDFYCLTNGVHGPEWIDIVKQYERKMLDMRC
jgi:L-rhamnose isomerase